MAHDTTDDDGTTVPTTDVSLNQGDDTVSDPSSPQGVTVDRWKWHVVDSQVIRLVGYSGGEPVARRDYAEVTRSTEVRDGGEWVDADRHGPRWSADTTYRPTDD